MPTKIYHKDHGFVITSDPSEIKRILDKGGKIVIKNKEIEEQEEPAMKLEKPQTIRLNKKHWNK